MTDLVNQLLSKRGLITSEAIERFLRPSYERDLFDPFLLSDMKKAVVLINEAVTSGDKIAIYADYDADGVPGAVVLNDWFKKIGYQNLIIYFPDRHEEAFGLNDEAIKLLASVGAKLLITVDCGITDVTQVSFANSLGLKVIITDHHLPPENVLPEAAAIINPKKPGDEYPEKMLCGAGVAFKLVQALIQCQSQSDKVPAGWEKWLLDLVAIATISDMVPLLGENRVLAHFGLKVLRRSPRPGLKALFRLSGLSQQNLTEDDVGFTIGPRLNAASRMTHASEAYRLLSTTNELEAEELARHLEAKNRERRIEVDKIILEVRTRFNDLSPEVWPKVLVLGHPDWSLGVLGLAANRLAEEYSRPVFLWSKNSQGLIKGSCRAAGGKINIVDLMRAAGGEEIFSSFGGHAASGGFSCLRDKLEDLESRLITAYDLLPELLGDEPVLPDAEVAAAEFNFSFWQELALLAPFGLGNPKPLFALQSVSVTDQRIFGKSGTHLELALPRAQAAPLKAIKFFYQDSGYNWSGSKIDLLANLEESNFRGRSELRLRIVEIKPAS